MVETVFFYIFAFLAIGTAVGVVAARNPLYSALSLIGTFFALTGLYVLLGAHLLAALQVLVYAGAIMVLFVFVLMLLNLKDEELGEARPTAMKWAGGAALGLGGLVLVWRVLSNVKPALEGSVVPDLARHAGFGTVDAVGRTIYGPYLLPFEVTSTLLLVSIVAAVVVAKAKI